MSLYHGDYQADLGRDFYAVTMRTRFVVGEGVEAVLDDLVFLPPSFLASVSLGSGPCSLPITPRRVLLYLSDILQLQVPLPFRGGTPAYSQFLAEVAANSGVLAFDILPENSSPYHVVQQVR